MNSLTSTDTGALATLPADVRMDVRTWVARLEALRPPITRALRDLARSTGVSFATVRRKHDAYLRDGWRGLVNRAKCRDVEAGLPDALVGYWKTLCVENQRKCRPAYLKLVREFHDGAPIPGVPEGTSRTELPPGWSYPNMMRFKPTAFELKAVRIGRTAASDLGPMVYTTRVGMSVGEFYLFDDLVHDHFVNVLDTRRHGRPVEFHALDLKSGCKMHWGIAARTESDLTGRMESLKESHMRFLLASLLSRHGYRSQGGTTMVVENGTAAIRGDLEQLLYDLSPADGRIRVNRAGMQGDPAFIGQYGGRGKGNFRFKGALESLGNLIHNEMADTMILPGQTGRNTDTRQEELHGLQRHNDALLNAMVALQETRPEIARLLRFPVVSLAQFREIADTIYARINARTDHRLEGWDMMCVPADGGQTMRRLSPAEVWDGGRRGLVPLPPQAIAQILYRDEADEVRVTDRHEIEIVDKSVSADVLRFNAAALRPGEKYQAVLNPFATAALFLFDAAGRYLGEIPRISRIVRADEEAIKREMGRVRSELTTRLAPVAAMGHRITAQRMADARANTSALRELTPSDESYAARRAARAGRAATTPDREPGTDPEPVPDEVFQTPSAAAPDAAPVDEVF